MSVLQGLQPERVFYYFEEICNIPHASYHTAQIGTYFEEFAKQHHLKYVRDAHDNVVIYKDASAGYEDAPTVIIQGHSDMVAEKDADSNHDFATEGLKLLVEGDYLFADKTTLGGDDGIAVAFALAVLEDTTLAHPALEVVLTSNEEVGLLGASALDTSILKGTRMINIDSNEEGELLAGCAGGLTAKTRIPVQYVEDTNTGVEIVIDGLQGGHSGTEINKYRANSNILMGRLLHTIGNQMEYMLAELEGGQKDNVITKSSRALILINGAQEALLIEIIEAFQNNMRNEYRGIDDQITIHATGKGICTEPVLHPISREKVVFLLMNTPFGVQQMSGLIPGLVTTSMNLGILKLHPAFLEAGGSIRSSVGSAKDALSDKVQYLTEFLGGEYDKSGEYPAWEYQEHSALRTTMTTVYKELFQKEMEVTVIHAGLECGIFFDKIPGLDCVSFGPNVMDIHTTKERISISSTNRMWEYLVKVLKSLK